MRILAALVMLVCAARVARADCANTSTIDGRAVDAAGHGVPDVHIRVEPADLYPRFVASSGSDGRFQIPCVRIGVAYLEAATDTLGATPQVVAVPRHGHAVVRFDMVATLVAGLVTDPSGAAVAHAKISVHGPVGGTRDDGQEAETDDRGRFAIYALPPGRYRPEVTVGGKTQRRLVTTGDDHLAVVAR